MGQVQTAGNNGMVMPNHLKITFNGEVDFKKWRSEIRFNGRPEHSRFDILIKGQHGNRIVESVLKAYNQTTENESLNEKIRAVLEELNKTGKKSASAPTSAPNIMAPSPAPKPKQSTDDVVLQYDKLPPLDSRVPKNSNSTATQVKDDSPPPRKDTGNSASESDDTEVSKPVEEKKKYRLNCRIDHNVIIKSKDGQKVLRKPIWKHIDDVEVLEEYTKGGDNLLCISYTQGDEEKKLVVNTSTNTRGAIKVDTRRMIVTIDARDAKNGVSKQPFCIRYNHKYQSEIRGFIQDLCKYGPSSMKTKENYFLTKIDGSIMRQNKLLKMAEKARILNQKKQERAREQKAKAPSHSKKPSILELKLSEWKTLIQNRANEGANVVAEELKNKKEKDRKRLEKAKRLAKAQKEARRKSLDGTGVRPSDDNTSQSSGQ